MKKIDNLFYL